MSAAPTRSSRDELLGFLDDLDSYATPLPPTSLSTSSSVTNLHPTASNTTAATSDLSSKTADEAQSVLNFLDEMTKRSSTPTSTKGDSIAPRRSITPGLTRAGTGMITPLGSSRRSGESVRSRGSPAYTPTTLNDPSSSTLHGSEPIVAATVAPATDGGWGWSSVWSSATAIAQQARTVAEEQVKTVSGGAPSLTAGIGGLGGGLMKALGENEQAKKWGEGVIQYAKAAQLDKLGQELKSTTIKSLTDLLNAVAPPIAEHEVIQVSLSHDMIGYDGIENLVYRGLTQIMDQIEGGTLIVNRGNEEKSKSSADAVGDERNLNFVEGLEEGWKLAEANIEVMLKTFVPSSKEPDHPDSLTVPVTTCPIYMRIQPCVAALPFLSSSAAPSTALFFLLILRDPTHNLSHSSISQSIPSAWLDIPFEENEWVEDVMVDVIRRGVEVIGQEYINHRMRAQTIAIGKAREEAQARLDLEGPPPPAPVNEEEEEDSAVAVASSRV